MKHTIVSDALFHLDGPSTYNHNYYRDGATGDVILEIFHEDDGGGDWAEYYNLGADPTFTNADFKSEETVRMGVSEECFVCMGDPVVEADTHDELY